MAETYVTDKHGPQNCSGSYADLVASDGTNKHSIRTFSIVNTTAGALAAFISIGAGATGTEVIETTVPANSTVTLNGMWNVPTSTAVQIKGTTGVTITASGYHVT